MPLLTGWVAGLAGITRPDQLAASHHRVIHPGGQPLHGSGLVRHQAVGPLQRPGQPPEYLSLMSFFVPVGQESALRHGDLARALGALITFMVNRRVDVLAEVAISMEDQPDVATFLPIAGVPDRALLAPFDVDQARLDQLLREHLALLAGLDEKDAEVISAALDMHYGACLLLDRDIASAYTLLVAGLEAMSRRFGRPPSDWSDWDQAATWDKFCAQNALSEEQAQALRDTLMRDRQLRLNETFATYASATLPDSFWDGRWQDWLYTLTMPAGTFTGGDWTPGASVEELVPRNRKLLKAALKRSYVARSGFVHAGDRAVDINTEFMARVMPDHVSRLSFPGLRLLLRGLIEHELRTRSSGEGVVPEIAFTLEANNATSSAQADSGKDQAGP